MGHKYNLGKVFKSHDTLNHPINNFNIYQPGIDRLNMETVPLPKYERRARSETSNPNNTPKIGKKGENEHD